MNRTLDTIWKIHKWFQRPLSHDNLWIALSLSQDMEDAFQSIADKENLAIWRGISLEIGSMILELSPKVTITMETTVSLVMSARQV